MPNITISGLPPAILPLDGATTLFEVTVLEAGEEVSRQVSVDNLLGGFGLDATFVTVTANAALPNERILTGGTGITIVDGGAGSTITLNALGLDAQFLTLALDGNLANERVLTAGTGISFVDGGPGSTLTINVTGVVPDPLLLNAGLVTAPTYSYTLDPNTGVFNVGADILGFAAGGALIAQADESNGAGNLQFIILPGAVQNNATFPAFAFGDGDSGLFEPSDDQLGLTLAAVQRWFWSGDIYGSLVGGGAAIRNVAASATIPTLHPNRGNLTSGIGSAGVDILSHIAGGIEGLRQTEVVSHILFDTELHAGLTASTTQTQAGALQLLSSCNEIAIVANVGDAIVLPEARVGRFCEIINDGVNALQIFPAVGDDLGAGVDLPSTLDQNAATVLRGIDSVNWRPVTPEVTHSSFFDENNTDVFVISAVDDFHSYHSNGIQVGDEIGWTFDIGGAGTSFPIASIADGAASGVDIAVTTTGAHGLAVGDVISQTNLASAVYTGIFVVKAIISPTIYEVAAVFTATDTGTMDQAATLEASSLAAGVYEVIWSSSMTSSVNNETFDFNLFNNALVIVGSSARRKFGTAMDFGGIGGITPRFDVATGDKISFAVSNTDSAGDLTVRNLVVSLTRAQ